MIPVVAPIGIGDDGHTYNINADTMAGAVAAAMGAARLFLLTHVQGVLDKQGELLTDLTPQEIGGLVRKGRFSAGRFASVTTCARGGNGRGIDHSFWYEK